MKKQITQKDIYNVEHPARKKAIEILEHIQGNFLCKKCIKNTDGENWYLLEDYIVGVILGKKL